MNEFIVWDEAINDFIAFDMIPEFCRPDLSEDCVFQYIGKKDINGNKIYSDCSIVEFEYFETIDKAIKLKGYFRFNKESLDFELSVFTTVFKYSNKRMRNFKIIDTIQQNKLGLIK